MRWGLRVPARTANGGIGLLAGGMALGWLPVLVFCEGHLVMAADSRCFPFFAGLFLIGAVFGAAFGTASVNKAFGKKTLFWQSFKGGMIGLVVGGLVELLCLVVLDSVYPSLDPPLLVGACPYVPALVGAVIGSGWKTKPANGTEAGS